MEYSYKLSAKLQENVLTNPEVIESDESKEKKDSSLNDSAHKAHINPRNPGPCDQGA